MSNLIDLQSRAMEVRAKYEQYETKKYGQPWTTQQLADGYRKDIDDLISILKSESNSTEEIGHELADCLWSVLVLSKKLDIDLEGAFNKTMQELHTRLDKELT